MKFVVLLCLFTFSASLTAWAQEPTVQEGMQEGMNGSVTRAMNWQRTFYLSGVDDVLDQANDLIEQEVKNLAKTPLGFSDEQLASLNAQFQAQLGAEPLKQAMIAQLQQHFSPQDLMQLEHLLSSEDMQLLQQMQDHLKDAEVRREMRSYKLRVKENAPRSRRMGLLVSLDEHLQQSALETRLKVELRKQLLVMVSQMKTQQTFPEDLLNEQLIPYQESVQSEISENALYAYLFLLKHTPSQDLKAMLSDLQQPLFERYMAACLLALEHSFLEARQQMDNSVRLAAD